MRGLFLRFGSALILIGLVLVTSCGASDLRNRQPPKSTAKEVVDTTDSSFNPPEEMSVSYRLPERINRPATVIVNTLPSANRTEVEHGVVHAATE